MDESMIGMEKPTVLMDALQRVSRLVAEGEWGRVRKITDAAVQTVNRPAGMYEGGLHAHACVEICFAGEGMCRLWTAQGSLTLAPGELLMVPPGIRHCEGWVRRDGGYHLVWLVLVGDLCSAFVSTYRPKRGWLSEDRVSATSSGAAEIARVLAAGPDDDQPLAARCNLQGGLLSVLGDLLRAGEKPDTGAGSPGDVVDHVEKYIELHYREELTVNALGALFRLSPNYLNSLFSARKGMGIRAHLLEHRLAVARRLLCETRLLVKEISYQVGFSDPLYFSRLYRQRFGYPPSAEAHRGGSLPPDR